MSPQRLILAVVFVLSPPFAHAQTSPDVATLAKTVQRLSQRVDHLQKEVDQLKAASSPNATSIASPAVPPPKRSGPSKDVSVKGWAVDVVPADNPAKDALVTFSWDKPEFNFSLHTRQLSGHNPFTYRANAQFFPAEQARYVFQLTLEPVRINSGYSFVCTGNLKINGEQVIDARANGQNASGQFDRNGELFGPVTTSGGVGMEPPSKPDEGYNLTLEVSCFYNEQDHAQLPDFLFKPWQDNRFSILVKGPDDAAGRPFAGDELFHKGKVKAGR